jgi:cellulose synthase/poly-beta-1,6-N-acetylglucosamine synthase-like glycosyltransferase
MIYQIGFQRKQQITEASPQQRQESVFLESGYQPGFDTIRRLLNRFDDGDVGGWNGVNQNMTAAKRNYAQEQRTL